MSTHRVNIRQARQSLRHLLDQVQAGDEVVLLRRGVEVARLVRPQPRTATLPDLSGLRASVKVRGAALSRDIRAARRSSRF